MDASTNVTAEVVTRLIETKDFAGIRTALDTLLQVKTRIEAQLAESKGQMAEVRSELLRAGEDPRIAQITATGSTDQGWRGRAVGALKGIDGKMGRLRSALRSNVVPEKASNTGKAMPERKAICMHGTPEEITDNIQSWIDDGWSPVQTLACPRTCKTTGVALPPAVIVVLRKDFG